MKDITEFTNKIICGDCLEVLKTLPEKSIDMSISSPPYWALRDYGVDGQLGLEPDFNTYINKLCDIYDEVKRVLKDTGTCWVNLGDTYYTKSGSSFLEDNISGKTVRAKGINKANEIRGGTLLPSKCLTLVPFRFAIEMVNRGWILRNTIIWHKPNCMPSSVKDRFTVDFEYIFFFSKKKKYYFERQLVPIAESSKKDSRLDKGREEHIGKSAKKVFGCNATTINSSGRNKRAVWKITTKGFKEAHFAVYPEKLIETPIKVGCPEFICKKCGKPREKIYESTRNIEEEKKLVEKIDSKAKSGYDGSGKILSNDQTTGMQHRDLSTDGKRKGMYNKTEFTGEYSKCNCNAGFESGIVLDPFMGAGTTALVSLKQNKKFIGIELNPEYCAIAENRLKAVPEKLNKWFDGGLK